MTPTQERVNAAIRLLKMAQVDLKPNGDRRDAETAIEAALAELEELQGRRVEVTSRRAMLRLV